MKIFIFILLILLPNILLASEEVLIEDPALVSQLIKIQDSLDKVSTAVMKCIDSGEKHSICLCQNKSIIIEFNNTVKSTLEKSTNFKSLDLVRFKHPDGEWITQSLEGIKLQANNEPSCT